MGDVMRYATVMPSAVPFRTAGCQHSRLLALLLTSWGMWAANATAADSFATAPEVNSIRIPMPNEGFLSFRDGGEERTGWTDVRHPAYFNGEGGEQVTLVNPHLGYDRSDFFVRVRNITVTDSQKAATVADLVRDYDFANAAFAQLGISVITEANVSATYPDITFPLSSITAADGINILAANRADPHQPA